MAGDGTTALVLRGFTGLDQSKAPELISYTSSPDAVNMDTAYGSLRVAAGYKRLDVPAVPGGVSSMGAFYRRADGREWVICTNDTGIYAYAGDMGGFDDDSDKPPAAEWTKIYTPPQGSDGKPGHMGAEVDFLNYQDKESDVVLMADGEGAVLTWSGEGQAVPREGITPHFAHIELNYERVWGAGAPGEPDTVYWSRQFDVGDWTPDAKDPDQGGGYVMVPTWDGGKIRLIRTLFNDIVIFKDHDILKLTGTYPGEYNVSRINGVVGPVAARTVVQYGDRVYFLGRTGLCYYDGVRAVDAGDRRAQGWYNRMNDRFAERAVAIVKDHMMYIALPVDDEEKNGLVLEYDMQRDTIMARRGIEVAHWIIWDDRLLFAGSDGYVYEYGVGDTYDGRPIEAHWTTPVYSMGSSSLAGDRTTKQLGELTAYGRGRMHIMVDADGKRKQRELFMTTHDKRSRKRINIRGRRFQLTLSAVDGVPFEIYGALTIEMDVEAD